MGEERVWALVFSAGAGPTPADEVGTPSVAGRDTEAGAAVPRPENEAPIAIANLDQSEQQPTQVAGRDGEVEPGRDSDDSSGYSSDSD